MALFENSLECIDNDLCFCGCLLSRIYQLQSTIKTFFDIYMTWWWRVVGLCFIRKKNAIQFRLWEIILVFPDYRAFFVKRRLKIINKLVVCVIIVNSCNQRFLNERKFVVSVEMKARNKWIRHFPLIWSWSWANRKKGGEVKQRRDSSKNKLMKPNTHLFYSVNNYYYFL